MTTKEAFGQLVSKRGWYKDLGISESTANNLAARYRDNKGLSIERMEEVLEKAGYKVVQEKQWASRELS